MADIDIAPERIWEDDPPPLEGDRIIRTLLKFPGLISRVAYHCHSIGRMPMLSDGPLFCSQETAGFILTETAPFAFDSEPDCEVGPFSPGHQSRCLPVDLQ